MPHVVIIGGGISGLSTAFALQEACQKVGRTIDCTLIDSREQWGGKIQTSQVQGLIIEGGPDSFLSLKPWALELCKKLGLSDQLMNTIEENSQTFSYSRGKLRELPQGLISFIPTRVGSLISSGLLSWPGILRMGAEWFVPPSRESDLDESLASFFCRRVGQEAFDRLIEPLVAGIYAGDANELSLKATFPRFHEMEQKYGGLIKGVLAQRSLPRPPSSGPKRTIFTTLRGGLGDLVETLIKRVESNGATLRLGQPVLGLQMTKASTKPYKVVLRDNEVLMADGVVLATPAFVSSKLVKPLHEYLSNLLEQIPYSSTATISLAYQQEDVTPFVRGFGFVVPRKEGKSLIAATWTSLKWANRAQPKQMLIRCYVGGKGREAILDYDDVALVNYVREELRTIVGMTQAPLYTKVYRWERSMPQYTCGHLNRLQQIRDSQKLFQRLYLTGAAYEGIGIPDCIREGTRIGKNWPNPLVEKFKVSCSRFNVKRKGSISRGFRYPLSIRFPCRRVL